MAKAPDDGEAVIIPNARLHGVLRYLDEEECFVVEDNGAVLVSWPPGTEVVIKNGKVGIRAHKSRTVWVGDKLSGGGGFAPGGVPPEFEVDPTCHAGGYFEMYELLDEFAEDN